jgi:hypothetical protein
LHLDPPLPPGGGHIVEVLTDALVTEVSAAADAEHRQELDLRVADRERGVEIGAIYRVGEATHRFVVPGAHR